MDSLEEGKDLTPPMGYSFPFGLFGLMTSVLYKGCTGVLANCRSACATTVV